MSNEFPDPSTFNNIDFYSSAFKIKLLLRRRGYDDVIPMGGKPDGFMPIDHFRKWDDYQKRLEEYKKDKKGLIRREFERYVAQIICKHYCNPATYSNKVLDLEPGGDYDILVEGPGEVLFHFETKTTSCEIEDLWNFMVRESRLGADMSVFLIDMNHSLEDRLLPAFEFLFEFAKFIEIDGKIKAADEIDVEHWLNTINQLSNIPQLRRKIAKNIYFIYFPVLVISGGDNTKKNIKEALAIYHRGIKLTSPFSRLSKMESGLTFSGLPNWNLLPQHVKKNLVKRKIKELTNWDKRF